MAQVKYRGNLSAKVFPFLSSQFGQSVIVNGMDQAAGSSSGSDAAGGDNNIPQAYYMHNVVPTAQGYKSVGYKQLIAGINATAAFDRVIPIRDANKNRGILGITKTGKIYIYRAGDVTWTLLPAIGNWENAVVSYAHVNDSTYLCIPGKGVFLLDVTNRTIKAVTLTGVDTTKVTFITSAANYLIITDGITIYWSSTLTPEDFVPSQVTGAGSGKIADAKGLIVALVPIGTGFAVYTAANVVIAAYTQNARFPWVFKGADNSLGVSDVQHITYSGDSGTNYAWTSAGLQRINTAGTVTIMAEVTDFLAGQEFEDFDSATNELKSEYTESPFKLKLEFVGARYLIASYGVDSLTHALVYDSSLKRWGKLKYEHTCCFEINFNTDAERTVSSAASAKKTLGLMDKSGKVVMCDFNNNAQATDSVLLLGKYQLVRSRMTTLDKVTLESIDADANFELAVKSTLDGKTADSVRVLTASAIAPRLREYNTRITGANHTLVVKGRFNLNSLELALHINGKR